jgi:hypothetical protein
MHDLGQREQLPTEPPWPSRECHGNGNCGAHDRPCCSTTWPLAIHPATTNADFVFHLISEPNPQLSHSIAAHSLFHRVLHSVEGSHECFDRFRSEGSYALNANDYVYESSPQDYSADRRRPVRFGTCSYELLKYRPAVSVPHIEPECLCRSERGTAGSNEARQARHSK